MSPIRGCLGKEWSSFFKRFDQDDPAPPLDVLREAVGTTTRWPQTGNGPDDATASFMGRARIDPPEIAPSAHTRRYAVGRGLVAARGYAIMVQLADGTYTRAVDIDASRGRYILVLPEDVQVEAAGPEAETAPRRRGRPPGTGRKGRRVSVPRPAESRSRDRAERRGLNQFGEERTND